MRGDIGKLFYFLGVKCEFLIYDFKLSGALSNSIFKGFVKFLNFFFCPATFRTNENIYIF